MEYDNVTESHKWRNARQPGKRVPLPGAGRTSTEGGIECRTVPNIGEPTCNDDPVPLPPHITAQIQAWQTQEQLYRGAVWPFVASDDPPLSLSQPQRKSRACCVRGHMEARQDGHAYLPMPSSPAVPLQPTVFCSNRDRARGSLLRHCSPSMPSQVHNETGLDEHPPCPNAIVDLNTISPIMSHAPQTVYMDRVAGGGSGFQEASLYSHSNGHAAMQDVTYTGVADASPQIRLQNLQGPQNNSASNLSDR